MELEIIILSELSKKDKYQMISLIYGIFKKVILIYKPETDSQTNLWLPKGKGRKG